MSQITRLNALNLPLDSSTFIPLGSQEPLLKEVFLFFMIFYYRTTGHNDLSATI